MSDHIKNYEQFVFEEESREVLDSEYAGILSDIVNSDGDTIAQLIDALNDALNKEE